MPINPPSPLKQAAFALQDAVTDLVQYTTDPSDVRLKPAFDKVSTLLDRLRDIVGKSKTSNMADFFLAIGNGVIEAQQQLDRASESYVRSLMRGSIESDPLDGSAPATTPPLLGSTFRIPRVTAEFKCSLEADHDKKLNVVFYSDRSDVRELHQQTVQLEVVAVPISPDYINSLRTQPADPVRTTQISAMDGDPHSFQETLEANDAMPAALSDDLDGPAGSDSMLPSQIRPPRPPHDPPLVSASNFPDDESPLLRSLVTARSEREDIRELIEKIDPSTQEGSRRILPEIGWLLAGWSRALVLTDGGSARVILLALPGKRPRLLLWHLHMQAVSLQLLYKMPKGKKKTARLAAIHHYVSQLGEQQESIACLPRR